MPRKNEEKARQQQLPFTCFRIDEGSQKGHFFVEIHEFSKAIDEIYLKNRQSFTSAVQKSTNLKDYTRRGRLKRLAIVSRIW
jgi:hypothetical protein